MNTVPEEAYITRGEELIRLQKKLDKIGEFMESLNQMETGLAAVGPSGEFTEYQLNFVIGVRNLLNEIMVYDEKDWNDKTVDSYCRELRRWGLVK